MCGMSGFDPVEDDGFDEQDLAEEDFDEADHRPKRVGPPDVGSPALSQFVVRPSDDRGARWRM
eukprot:10544307-Lingulodinium_polyedra.AAC.1